MPKVIFADDADKSVDAEPGEPLIKLCKRTGAKIVFGCEAGVCGTCIINVLEGAQNLSQKEEQEKDSLTMFSARDNQRLACQAKVNGDVKIEKGTDV